MHSSRHAFMIGAGAVCLFTTAAILSAHDAHAQTTKTNSVIAAVYQSNRSADARNGGNRFSHRPFQHPCAYTVKPADTLWEIAHVSGVTVSALKHENGLKSDVIDIGQRLLVPRKWRAFMHKTTKAAPDRPSWRDSLTARRVLLRTTHLANAPARLLPIYEGAGARYGIPWTVLAAIHETETNFGITNCPNSEAGAEGPMQFLPSTFESYAVKAPGHAGPPNIQNVGDAIYTAAHMLSADGYASNPTSAIYAYNRSFAYVRRIETLAGLK